MQYTDKTTIENYLKRTIDSSFSTQVTAYIEAMSDWCDELAGFPIYRDTETTRQYDGSGQSTLTIEPTHTISEVRVDGTAVTPKQYPLNNDVKRELYLETQSFSRGQGNVEVDGIFSLKSSQPARLTLACTILCALILNQVDEQSDGVASEKIGDFQVSFRNPKDRQDFEMAKDIIMSFKPVTF